MFEIVLIKTGPAALQCAYESDQEKLKELKIGQQYKFKKSDDRNPLHHKKLMAIFHVVADNTENFGSVRQVMEYCKIKAGEVDIIGVNGEIHVIPRSISFDKMGQSKFNEFYKKSVDICAGVLGIDPEALQNESMERL